MTDTAERIVQVRQTDGIVLRFAGDSGDGMQLTGDRFTSASALFGNDLSTLPEFPAEIRAPAGTLAGVSAFQVHISDHDITTPGDAPTVLVAMNPAALRSDLRLLAAGGTVIVNADAFTERNLAKAGYEANPLDDDTLDGYTVVTAPMTELTKKACKELGVKPRDAERSKNFFALGAGVVGCTRQARWSPLWTGSRCKFGKPGTAVIGGQHGRRCRAGHAFGETSRTGFHSQLQGARPPATRAGHVHQHQRRHGACRGGWWRPRSRPSCRSSWPRTPSRRPPTCCTNCQAGIRTSVCARFQAEDEIAAVCARPSAPPIGGHIGVTTTSGPGLALKAEAIGLAREHRVAPRGHRHPAGRPLHRPAHQDRGRPT